MKFKEFTIGASHTFNLGNFESMRIEASVTVEPEKGEREVVSRAQSQLRKLIEDTLKSQPHSELLVMLHELHIARAKQRQQMKDMENDRQQSADEPPEPPAGYGT